MHPVLFTLRVGEREFALRSYGVAIAIGFIVAIAVSVRRAKRYGEDADAVRDLCFWLLVSSLAGARLLFVLTNVRQFAAHGFARALNVWEGGLVFYGGLLAAIACAVWFTRRHGLRFARVADLLAPQIALGHFFGRLGCYAAGCCWGAPTTLPWAVRFPSESIAFQQLALSGRLSDAADVTAPLHPVQLYEAGGNLALFALLGWLLARKRWDGQVLVAYLIGYACLRFACELVRADPGRKFVIPSLLSTSQAIALLMIPLAVALWMRYRTVT